MLIYLPGLSFCCETLFLEGKDIRSSASLSQMYRFLVPQRVRMMVRKIRRRLHQPSVKRHRRELLKVSYPQMAKRLIIFLSPGSNEPYGGVLSITSLFDETKKLEYLHSAETIMCTVPGEALILRYTWFRNRNYLYDLGEVLFYFRSLESLLIHIPEYAIGRFLRGLSDKDYARLAEIKDLRLNLLLQNLLIFRERVTTEDISRLRSLGKLTCTTAHERYSTRALREELGIPLYRLSTYVSPEQYERRSYAGKENLLIVSPDVHPRKAEVLDVLLRSIPEMKIQVVRNLAYEDYKKLITRAKWALTFGEGLDGYFIETVFSGGVSFSVYNSVFFTEDFRSLKTVYSDYDTLLRDIVRDLKELDQKEAYFKYQREQFDLCHEHYSYEKYRRNIEAFYRDAFN